MQVPTATTKAYIDMLLDVALHQVGFAPHSRQLSPEDMLDDHEPCSLIDCLQCSAAIPSRLSLWGFPQSLPCILAAMVPCTRLYAYIGCQLRAAAMAAPNTIRARGPYGSWIKEYSSDAFLGLPASKEALLDKLGSSVPYGETLPLSSPLHGIMLCFCCT